MIKSFAIDSNYYKEHKRKTKPKKKTRPSFSISGVPGHMT